MSKVYVKFPKTGLGNLLLVWARALVFAHLNNLTLVTTPWWAIRPGAWLRNERKKRLYWGYFKESSPLDRWKITWHSTIHPIIKEPPVKKISDQQKIGNAVFVFSEVIVDNDLFGSVRNHADLVKNSLYAILTPALQEQLTTYEMPVISIHIRRGDFKTGNPITPESFFLECLQNIRRNEKEDWPVTVFSDADEDEIKQVLALPGATLATPKADILDILLMSKSKVIITSQSSTFSYWAAFLSEALVIMPADDWQKKIKDEKPGSTYREIRWKEGKLPPLII